MYLEINRNIKVSSPESSENIQKTESGSYYVISDNECSAATLDKLTLNARRLYRDFMTLTQDCLFQRLFKSKAVSKKRNSV